MTREEAIKILNKENNHECTWSEYCEAYNMAIKALEQQQTIDYRRAFKIACELLNGSILYGVDADRIFEIMMDKNGVVSSDLYEEYILNHLQELDQGQYAEVEE